MALNDIFRILRQRGWLILVLMVLTAAAAFGFSRIQTPVYQSNLKLLVLPSRTDFGQAQAAKALPSSRPDQWASSACFSSRPTPMRGNPRECVTLMDSDSCHDGERHDRWPGFIIQAQCFHDFHRFHS